MTRPTSSASLSSSFEACGADPNPHNSKKAASASASATTLHRKIRLTGSQLTSSTASLTVSAAEDDDDNDNDRNSDHNEEDSFTDLICRHHHHHRTERQSVRFRHPPAVLLGPSNHVRRSLYASTIRDKDGGGDDGKDRVVLVERGTEQVGSSNDDRQGLWYSKAEVQGQRHDVQKTIRSLRKHAHCPEGSAHVLLSASSSSSSCQNNREPTPRSSEGDAPTRGLKSTVVGESVAEEEEVEEGRTSVRSGGDESKEQPNDDVCYRGCERYYSLETRFMAQKMVVDAVLDAQARHRKMGLGVAAGGSEDEKKEEDGFKGSKEEALRILSEEISKPGRELAHWHATLNAFQCYGFSGLTVSSASTSAAANKGDRLPRNRSKQKHARAKTLQADTLWWEQAVLTTVHKDGKVNPPVVHPATTSPLTSDEDDDDGSSSDDGGVGGRRQEEANVAPATCAANVVTPPPKHRRSRSMPSPPTEYIFAPTTTNAAKGMSGAATTTTASSAACASPSATFPAFPDRVPHVVPLS
jgi:hypothetical protein